jgi:hypothetical protein
MMIVIMIVRVVAVLVTVYEIECVCHEQWIGVTFDTAVGGWDIE